MKTTVFLFLAVVVAFQLWVSYRIWRTDVYEHDQKKAQLTFIWMLPALGAVIAFYVLKDADPTMSQNDSNTEQRNG